MARDSSQDLSNKQVVGSTKAAVQEFMKAGFAVIDEMFKLLEERVG